MKAISSEELRQDPIVITFKQQDAYGKVIIRATHFGIEIVLPQVNEDKAVAHVDFFTSSKAGEFVEHAGGVPQIQILDANVDDEPVAVTYFNGGRTQIYIDRVLEEKEVPYNKHGDFKLKLYVLPEEYYED